MDTVVTLVREVSATLAMTVRMKERPRTELK